MLDSLGDAAEIDGIVTVRQSIPHVNGLPPGNVLQERANILRYATRGLSD